MGLEGHQVIYALHYNTANYHLHIAVNRMNERTMKVVDPHGGFDIDAAHQVLALVEQRQGWSREKNARYAVNEHGKVVPRPRADKAKPKQPALDFECATGEKSAQRIAQERGHSIIENAQSWSELHVKLGYVGLRFEKKGSGAIIFVGEIAVKASSVDRAFSMGKLCKRLGEFAPGDYLEERKPIAPEPVSPVNLEEWKRYQHIKSLPVMTDPTMSLLREQQRRERETLPSRLRQALSHPPLDAASGPVRTCPRPILNIARHFQKLQHQKERYQIRRKPQGWVRKRSSGKMRFEDWLRDRGLDYKADRWRYRKALEALPQEFRGAPTVTATPKDKPLASYAAHKRAMLKAVPDAEFDRLIVYVALQMRKEGFPREVVADTIYHCAPEDRPEQPERNWRRYAERMAACAFGIEGDVRLARGAAAREKQRREETQAQEAAQKREEQESESQRPEPPRFRMR